MKIVKFAGKAIAVTVLGVVGAVCAVVGLASSLTVIGILFPGVPLLLAAWGCVAMVLRLLGKDEVNEQMNARLYASWGGRGASRLASRSEA